MGRHTVSSTPYDTKFQQVDVSFILTQRARPVAGIAHCEAQHIAKQFAQPRRNTNRYPICTKERQVRATNTSRAFIHHICKQTGDANKRNKGDCSAAQRTVLRGHLF